MANEIASIIDQLCNARESHAVLRDMYPQSHQQVQDAERLIATLTDRLVETATAAERKRCYDIVMAVRFAEIETDLRSVLSFIERGDTAEDLKKWSGRR